MYLKNSKWWIQNTSYAMSSLVIASFRNDKNGCIHSIRSVHCHYPGYHFLFRSKVKKKHTCFCFAILRWIDFQHLPSQNAEIQVKTRQRDTTKMQVAPAKNGWWFTTIDSDFFFGSNGEDPRSYHANPTENGAGLGTLECFQIPSGKLTQLWKITIFFG